MDELEKMLLMQVADLHRVPDGAYNIRKNGEGDGRRSTDRIRIEDRKDGHAGIDIFIAPETRNESVHIPVVLSQSGLTEVVYNDFYIGDDCDITIVAGCGIHNCGKEDSEHDGIHAFYVGKNSKVKYLENKKLAAEIRRQEKKLERAETAIEALDHERAALESEMNDTASGDYVRLSEITDRLTEIKNQTDALFLEMEEAESFLSENRAQGTKNE